MVVPNGFDETINFSGNVTPTGWTLTGGNSSVANERMEARQVDTYAYFSKAKTPPAGTVAVEICYTGNTVNAFWGQGTAAYLKMADGKQFNAALWKAGYGLNQLEATVGINNALEKTVITPPEFSTYRFYIRYEDGKMFYRANRSLDGVSAALPLVSVTKPLPGFLLSDIREIQLFAAVTTGSTSWVDDIEIRAVTTRQDKEPSHFTLLQDRSALILWPSVPGRKYVIHASTTLDSTGWSVVSPNPMAATDWETAFQVTGTLDPTRFYRIVQVWP